MAEAVTPTSLACAAGISIPYASQILGDKRTPSRSLAIHIYRKTGWKTSNIASLTEQQIDMLEQIEAAA
jgi:transcriptional regulator with XRE-family HTH domain